MTSAGLFVSCPDFRLTDRKLGGMKKNATMTKTKEKFLLADRTVKLKADVYENTLPNTHCGSVKATFKDQRLKLKKKKIRVVG